MTIGLDIGSSAVRAAEVHVGKDGKRTLARYGQVGLPPGMVVDGEIHDVHGVANALKKLWAESGFSRNTVVLGVSGPRVFIRQADVAPLSVEELRTSLKFDAQEMIPIPMEDASFDFSIIDAPQSDDRGRRSQRILLVAAHKDLLRTYTTTLKEAGLNASAMDAVPLALIRAVPSHAGDGEVGAEVLVSIGAELTTVAVQEAGVPRFIRTLTVGGAKLTETIAHRMHLELAVAERLKRGAVPETTPQLAQARKAMVPEVRELAEEVRATIDFFLAQSGGADISRLIITGGAAQTHDLSILIAGNLPASVSTLDPLAGLDTRPAELDDPSLTRVSAVSATAIGLALWTSGQPLIRLSVLPEEIAAAQRARRLATVAGTAVATLAGVLVVVGGVQFLQVHSAQTKAHAAEAHQALLSNEVAGLEKATAVHGQVQNRSAVVASALKGDVDWVRVMGQLASVMPSDLSLTSFSGSRNASAGTTTSSSSSAATGVGSVNFSVTGTGGLPAAAAWLDQLASDPDFSNVTLGGITVKNNGGAVQFSSTADLTATSNSNRAEEVHP